MKHKKWKRNYYIISFIAFIIILFFIDIYLEGSVAEYFVRELLDNREEVVSSYSGHSAVRGTFRWDRLRMILTFMAISGFFIVEVSIYFASKIYRNREKEKVLIQVEERLRQFKDDKNPTEVQELRLIDVGIKSILNEKVRIEQEKEMEIQKKNDFYFPLAHCKQQNIFHLNASHLCYGYCILSFFEKQNRL